MTPASGHPAARLREVQERIGLYLPVGGLFNPELMDHDKVSTLLIDARDAIAAVLQTLADDDSLGLSVDMLDVDRLREWARLLLVHGADIGHWASVPFVAGKMQTIATGLEKAIRDIGILRQSQVQLQQEKEQLRAELIAERRAHGRRGSYPQGYKDDGF